MDKKLRVLLFREEGPLRDGSQGMRWTAGLLDHAVTHATYDGPEDALRGLLAWVEANRETKRETPIHDPDAPDEAVAAVTNRREPRVKNLTERVLEDLLRGNEAAFWDTLPTDVPPERLAAFDAGKPFKHTVDSVFELEVRVAPGEL